MLAFGRGTHMPIPSGTDISKADRATLLWLYGGILLAAPPSATEYHNYLWVAGGVFVPGLAAGDVHRPGIAKGEVYIQGTGKGEGTS